MAFCPRASVEILWLDRLTQAEPSGLVASRTLLLPEWVELEVLVRAQAGFTTFGSAHLAEIFRAGVQAVPEG